MEIDSLVAELTPKAYAIAFRLCGRQPDAWDLVQNAMIRVLKNHHRYDAAYSVEQWLHQIVRNLYIDRLRREGRRREDPLDAEPREGSRALSETLADDAPPPEAALEGSERATAVQEALSELPVEWRMAVALVDLEGYSYDEAARILEIPASTLGVHVFRGRKRLRKSLESWRGA